MTLGLLTAPGFQIKDILNLLTESISTRRLCFDVVSHEEGDENYDVSLEDLIKPIVLPSVEHLGFRPLGPSREYGHEYSQYVSQRLRSVMDATECPSLAYLVIHGAADDTVPMHCDAYDIYNLLRRSTTSLTSLILESTSLLIHDVDYYHWYDGRVERGRYESGDELGGEESGEESEDDDDDMAAILDPLSCVLKHCTRLELLRVHDVSWAPHFDSQPTIMPAMSSVLDKKQLRLLSGIGLIAPLLPYLKHLDVAVDQMKDTVYPSRSWWQPAQSAQSSSHPENLRYAGFTENAFADMLIKRRSWSDRGVVAPLESVKLLYSGKNRFSTSAREKLSSLKKAGLNLRVQSFDTLERHVTSRRNYRCMHSWL